MKKTLQLIFLFIAVVGYAQKMEKDILGTYHFTVNDYQASFKKNVFDGLEFSDNKQNKISFDKKYLELKYPGALEQEPRRIELFEELLVAHQNDTDYQAQYLVDIFDMVIFKDNQGNDTRVSIDTFLQYNSLPNWDHTKGSLTVNYKGEVEYSSKQIKATLKELYTDNWLYQDNLGQSIELNEKAWQRMLQKYGSKEKVMLIMVESFTL